MFYLFTQTFFWLASVFIAGFAIGWWLRGKTGSDEKLAAQPESDQRLTDETANQYDSPDSWAPDGLMLSTVDSVDDLKLIKGVGPKMEERLNNLGIYTYSQVASLTENNLDWVRDRLKSTRQLSVENWVLSAKEKLAEKQAKSD